MKKIVTLEECTTKEERLKFLSRAKKKAFVLCVCITRRKGFDVYNGNIYLNIFYKCLNIRVTCFIFGS